MSPYLHFSRSLLRQTLIPTFSITILLAALCAPAQTPRVSWARQLTGTANDDVDLLSTALDREGNVFFGGTFGAGSVLFGNQVFTNRSVAPYSYDGFLAKYDKSGNLLWVQTIGGSGNDDVNACATDNSGNVFVTGWLGSSNVWFGTNLVPAAGGPAGFFVAKFDTDGNVLWVQKVARTEGAHNLRVDEGGNAHVTGILDQTNVAFGTNILSAGTPSADFVVEYSGSGELLWAKAANPAGYGNPNPSIATDGSGNTYFSDEFGPFADFGSITLTNSAPGLGLFLAKYDPAGNLLWAEQIAAGYSSWLLNNGLAAGRNGDCHIFSAYAGAPTVGNISLPAATGPFEAGAFLAKFDSAGNFQWVNPAIDAGPFWYGNLVVDPMDNCWIIATISAPTMQFGALTVTNSDPDSNNQHCFVARCQPNGNVLWAKVLDTPGVSTFASGAVDSMGSLLLCGAAAGTNALNLDGNVINGPTDGTNYFFAAKINGPSLNFQSLGTQLVISWPTNAVSLSLESAPDLSGGNWSPVTNVPVLVGGQYSITNDFSIGSRFYRLRNF